MESIKYVVTGVNDNNKYLNYLDVFMAAWKLYDLNVKIVIIYTGDKDENYQICKKNSDLLFHIKADSYAESVYFSQFSRLFIPSIINCDESDLILITDIDLIPLNRVYFDSIVNFETEYIYILRNVLFSENQYPIAYTVASKKIWNKYLFGGVTDTEIKEFMRKVLNHTDYNYIKGSDHWFTDQKYLYEKLNQIDPTSIVLYGDRDTNFKRCDRSQIFNFYRFICTRDDNIIKNYVDYHLPVLSNSRKGKLLAKLKSISSRYEPLVNYKYDKSVVEFGTFGYVLSTIFANMDFKGKDVLEMGVGNSSTLLLNLLAKSKKVKLYSADTSRVWLSKFLWLKSERHIFKYVPVYTDDWAEDKKDFYWDNIIKLCNDWGLVFIDHRPGERRVKDLVYLANHADVVVVHDSQESGYGLKKADKCYKYKYTCDWIYPHTTIYSNRINIDCWFDDIPKISTDNIP